MDFLFAKCKKNNMKNDITEILHLLYDYIKYIDFFTNKYKIKI